MTTDPIVLQAQLGKISTGETTLSVGLVFSRSVDPIDDLNRAADLLIGREHWCRFEVESEAAQKRIWGEDPPEVLEGTGSTTQFSVDEKQISLTLAFKKKSMDRGAFDPFAQQQVRITLNPGKKIEKPKRKTGGEAQVEGAEPADAPGQTVLAFDEQKRSADLLKLGKDDLVAEARLVGVAYGDLTGVFKAHIVKDILAAEAEKRVAAAAD